MYGGGDDDDDIIYRRTHDTLLKYQIKHYLFLQLLQLYQ